MYIPISAILFSLALSSVQSWLMHLRFNSLTGWLWLGVNTIGLAIAFVIAVGSLYPLVRIFRLDVLQNGTHGSIAMVAAIAIFTVVMIALQWSVLRRQVKASLLQAGLNVVVGAGAWFYLTTLFPTDHAGNISSLLLFTSLVSGTFVGAALERAVTLLRNGN
ncbi:MAG: hypothetical protein HC840_10045 [Leptolyngbyaceae cyanobacterium RM2_2_4]|nr:hypothetical protein [Leptolyngbyaceae cyanobacterium SM1_4_3]NJN90269.1 hypothetical protein [Leptolyngbyaceae cyanobacterium SL_5_14]NJO49719.1 hypothetical protein [Leptolyngbyaceae cyanobacterium RM2_2_4]NJO66877.1 hypothetical protein [Leptolyngbyaceae cyanobacterium RM1_405_57]